LNRKRGSTSRPAIVSDDFLAKFAANIRDRADEIFGAMPPDVHAFIERHGAEASDDQATESAID
jgi:hypothetical protein